MKNTLISASFQQEQTNNPAKEYSMAVFTTIAHNTDVKLLLKYLEEDDFPSLLLTIDRYRKLGKFKQLINAFEKGTAFISAPYKYEVLAEIENQFNNEQAK